MKRLFLAALTAAATLAAQEPGAPAGAPPPPHGFAGRGPMGLGMRPGKTITGAPYSADVTTSVNQTLADGNTINRTTHGHMARDSQGRTYSQQDMSGGPWAQNGPATVIFLADPVAGYSYVLNPNTKVAMRREFRRPPGDQVPPPDASRPRPRANGNDRVETELGSQVIEGINCTGRSFTHTIPAGAIGNAQAIVDKTETWTSPDLQLVVLSKRSDPRSGQSTYTLTNIQRSEPDASLFQVPSDYKIEDAPGWRRRR